MACFFSHAQVVNIPDPNFLQALLSASPSNMIATNINQQLMKIDVNDDQIIQASEAAAVHRLYLENKNISDLTGIQSFFNVEELIISWNHFTTLDISALQNLYYLSCSNGDITNLSINGLQLLEGVSCVGNANLTTVSLTNLPVLQSIQFLTNPIFSEFNVQNLPELKYFQFRNNYVSSLDLSSCGALTTIDCSDSGLQSLNLSGLTNITSLDCSNNELTILDLTSASALVLLKCKQNQIAVLDVSNMPNINTLHCYLNQIEELNFHPDAISVNEFFCHDNLLTSLDVSNFPNLDRLDCRNNAITTLDLSNSHNLQILWATNNNLTSLFLKNNSSESANFQDNPNLQYICADEFEVDYVQYYADELANGCIVNSYCSFTPGGTLYTITGNTTQASDLANCNDVNALPAHINLNIFNDISSAIITSDISGNYTFYVSEGTHTVTPLLENDYYEITPASFTIDYPGTTSPTLQNFCLTPVGVHSDLEVLIISLEAARPGFDAAYKIIYKNKGNVSQASILNLAYNGAVLDFVSSSVNATQTAGNLNWDLGVLNPFQTGEIFFIMNLNSPMEVPALNDGNTLSYTATISADNDETPLDNTFLLWQEVVNSFDPNDKTCLEGSAITPEMVGEYLHYVIRFENTGTFPAQNIVVVDMIDADSFDINTLVPLSASHPYITKIKGNKVEFLFENIMLPFDDENNDGYVAFKIKTLPTLQINSEFENSASIFFDYNFPIVTDPAVTSVQVLSRTDFDFASNFLIYPNPALDILNIKSISNVAVYSFEIYNVLGMLVLKIPNAASTSAIDLSKLKTGVYFLKINSELGTTNQKFVKK